MEVVAYTTLLMAGTTILVQVIAIALGVLACQAAASHALQATRVTGGTPAIGAADARAVLGQVAPRLVTNPSVHSIRTAGTSAVTISGTALHVLPGISIPISATATGPTEPETP